MQVQPISPETVRKYGGNRTAVSSVLTIEPRRRKFHKAITLTIPTPSPPHKGMLNTHKDSSNVRLLCSIVGQSGWTGDGMVG